MPKLGFLRIALLALVVLLFQGTWALAGTSGALSGQVVLNDGTVLAGAKVTATSPSESVSTTTDATGHFSFVSLIPDTYTVVVSKDGYDSVSQAGLTVTADNTTSTTIATQRSAKVIGTIPVRAAAELVKPGTTADVYSVNARSAAKMVNLGGGGGADNAYSAIASLPGVYVPVGQTGWYQSVYIRGGDYDQVGYEYDGVPVNRSFDNYPSSTASSLGQQSLQVYTGAAPANAESQGLAGFINQVIRTGTYPGFGTLDAAIGGPSLYNKVNLEFGGATPNRNFSYYVGIGGYNLRPRYYDQNNGASLTPTYGVPVGLLSTDCTQPTKINFVSCYASGIGPGGYNLGAWSLFNTFEVSDRETVTNFHIGIPHHNDSGKDDIQILYSSSLLRNPYYSSAQDFGVNFVNSFNGGPFVYLGGFQYNGNLLDTFKSGVVPNIITYSAPSSGGAAPFSPIPSDIRDSSENGQGIGKIQFQHNIGSNAYFRLYGYSYYSWWFLHGANSDNQSFVACCPDDYELTTHTRGVSGSFADQIDSHNLINFELSYTTASTVRNNNTQGFGAISGTRQRFAVLVNGASPQSGICYVINGATTSPASCEPFAVAPLRATFVKYAAAQTGSYTDVSAMTCGGGPCTYMVVEQGPWATFNTVKPVFTSASLTDQIKLGNKLQLDAGVRVDRFEFKGANTAAGPARQFWFNAWNASQCVLAAPGNAPFDKSTVGLDPTAACPAGSVPAILNNAPVDNTYTETQPRLGGTYTLNADNVLRFSVGKFVQAPNAAFQQYNTLQQNLPALLGNSLPFYVYGFNTPGHTLGPSVSNNSDFSWEHHFAGSDVSFKLSPYYRKTKDQYQQFFLDQKTGFVSGLPIGNQTSEGIEFQLSKGDFSANGLSGILSYTYLHAFTRLSTLQNGGTAFTPINNLIGHYNAYTSGCAGNTTNPVCGGGFDSTGTQVAAACYTPGGVPDAGCAAGDIANPYWNAPVRPFFDATANYIPFDIIPNGFNASAASYEVPHSATLVLNWKHDKWSFTPAFQFHAGGYYGAPVQTPGVDPAGGCAALAGSTSGDPRYPYGATGSGLPFDATTCGATLQIPNPYTGNYDQPGAFREPSQLTGHLQVAYEATARMTLQFSAANLINRCWGGNGGPWVQTGNSKVCGYGLPGYAPLPYTGNIYNPGASFSPLVQYPYMPLFGVQPTTYGVEAKITL